MNVPDDFEINNTKNKTKMADVRMQTIDHYLHINKIKKK